MGGIDKSLPKIKIYHIHSSPPPHPYTKFPLQEGNNIGLTSFAIDKSMLAAFYHLIIHVVLLNSCVLVAFQTEVSLTYL